MYESVFSFAEFHYILFCLFVINLPLYLIGTSHDLLVMVTSFCVFPCYKGDCEDHATLLCSLLLGFGLDAYVCVGTKAKNTPHTWVMTCGTDGSVTFWESQTAHR